MTFYKWLISNYLENDDPFGDLAKDVKSDDGFPKEAKDWKTIEEYLESKRASFAAIDTAKEAYKKYKE